MARFFIICCVKIEVTNNKLLPPPSIIIFFKYPQSTILETNNNFILNGSPVPPNFLDGYESLGEYLIQRYKVNGNKVILINGITSEEVTASQLLERSIRVAECLRNYGIKRGDKISICCENRFEFFYVFYGTIFLGATLSPINTSYTERELRHAINLSKPRIIFISSAIEKVANNLIAENSFIEKVIVFNDYDSAGTAIENISTSETFNNFLNNSNVVSSSDCNNFICSPENMRDNVCLIVCSSGTTGLPKGVQITQFNLLMTIASQFERVKPIENILCPSPIVLSVLPWFHVYGFGMAISMGAYYNTTVFLPKFEEKLFLQCIEKYKVDTALLVPPLMIFLAKNPLIDNYNLSSLKIVWCGAAPLKREIESIVKERIGVKVIRQGYGMSEGSMAFTNQSDYNQKPGSVGVLRLGVSCKVIDIETGKILGPNEPGELLFKGNIIMKGYIGDIEATNTTIDKDGWLRSGDIGYYDNDGEFYIVERLKELIKYKGFQVAPAEIEGLLLTHSKINDAAVVGLPDELAGELPLAFVVRKPNVTLTESEIIDFVAANVSYAKRLHGGVVFLNEIPKNASGKILRRKLREFLKNVKSKL